MQSCQLFLFSFENLFGQFITILTRFLFPQSTNLGALALYEKLGFARDEKLARYYLNGGRYPKYIESV